MKKGKEEKNNEEIKSMIVKRKRTKGIHRFSGSQAARERCSTETKVRNPPPSLGKGSREAKKSSEGDTVQETN